MRIHFIAIGGSAMHNLAIALHLKGEKITGSDDSIKDPSRSRLKKYGLLPDKEGWYPEHITEDLDLIILGMHARKDNPELIRARELGIKILSYPEYLYVHAREKTRIVIAGSHGKTTITSMVLHALNKAGIETDYMVGAQLEGFDNMVKLSSDASYMILEGDEYLSSPLDHRSKFLHYHPNILLISGIAWDHINVFPRFEDYLDTFRSLVSQLPENAVLIYDKEDIHLADIVNVAPASVKKIPYALPDIYWNRE
jgi:UDP-N-acetylmuramate: L-alanyl-gamma-D-glutamyl-meso-diaminopimelate ligase